ncbi:MAG TPA: HNH endonuclease signature motif containing protein [Candidatus Angelobacter sp.]
MKDPVSKLRSATRRAKSDVANKLIGMFLHELSRKISQNWPVKVDGEEYEKLVRERFDHHCPYCSCDLTNTEFGVEHLDGMNRYRAGLHVPGNVLVACRRCNSEKRRDDSLRILTLAGSGWESFLSHDGTRCAASCHTCLYWESIWNDGTERILRLNENLQRIRSFRSLFPEFERVLPSLMETQPVLLSKLYADCQAFAQLEIKTLLDGVDPVSKLKP